MKVHSKIQIEEPPAFTDKFSQTSSNPSSFNLSKKTKKKPSKKSSKGSKKEQTGYNTEKLIAAIFNPSERNNSSSLLEALSISQSEAGPFRDFPDVTVNEPATVI